MRFSLQLDKLKHISHKEFDRLNWLPVKVFDVAIENNFQLRGSFQKLKRPFRKTNNGQLALSYTGPTFWNKTPGTFKRTKNLDTFKHNLKKYLLNELKNCSNSF